MFKPVSPKVNFPQIEENVLKFWQDEKIFEKSLENRKGKQKFVFYDGPPFATGLPHYGHILAMTIKDAITRYKTMRGFYVPRRIGWDCHGLPVEYEVEKELKISGKRQIEEMGIDKFCEACRKIVFRYTKEWEKTINRMGRWADFENTYATLDTSYTESIWWVFRQLWDKGLIYQGFKSMPYCPRCATPLSNFETNQGYKDNVADPSIYIKFELVDEPKTYFLAWTTTPWTLPGNAALAVGPDIKYVKVKTEDSEYLILAKARMGVLDKGEVVEEIDAKSLIGKKYKPLFNFIPLEKDKKSYVVFSADFVSTEDGTGIVHIAPAFGEDDLNLGLKENLQIIRPVDEYGKFTNEVTPWAGKFVKDADKEIVEELEGRKILYRTETIHHTYPFCWRCETPLIYYAISTWFVEVSKIRETLVKNNQKIHWMPKHIREGRFGKWLADARDWAISRNRFWGAPLPIWQCETCKKNIVIGSLAELKEKQLGNEEINDLHRPFIDRVKIKCECGGEAERVPEVLDCWFESGSMPYAQDHYPFDDKEEFEKNFPADFIAEGLDQTRGWFYTLHVLATILFDEPAFKNCIVNGIILDKNGKKLSKRLRNYPEPEEVFEKYGADSMRLLLLSSPAALAEDLRISEEIIGDVTRRIILILWNVYNFFVTYANLDGWKPRATSHTPHAILDQWIISRLNQLIKEVTDAADDYNLPKAVNPIADFIINDLSTWYVRRSRDRIGPTAENSEDKNNCYTTLYEVLITLTKLLAPFTPFFVDEIYQNLTAEKSVHLSDWPEGDKNSIDHELEKEMKKATEITSLALAFRKQAQVKVRIPIKVLSYFGPSRLRDDIEKVVREEINVYKLTYEGQNDGEYYSVFGESGKKNLASEDLNLIEGQARELIRQIQQLRKEAGCALDEKIIVHAPSWPKDFEEYIKKQTLAEKLIENKELKIERIL